MESEKRAKKLKKGITACKNISQMKRTAYYELSKFGEHIRAEKEGLFVDELWSNIKNKKNILGLIEALLWRWIK